ncbi:hypothetical protein [Hymenobacter psychrotolerans]|uniref:Uncharacterized protein n=1 Tax=Hymenobacter psychrotolerans DSM 18569 TaxID=1121959 RepID=A0A1M6RU00_9BACT|nr:hypothetical protein [Hymenobacter psychrotolerans]SHK35858.1 hypothetical protein SAMN02746009_00793 [Hymenobacter psychrotolerans DSM 18569]
MSDFSSFATEMNGGLPAGFYAQMRTSLILVNSVCRHVFQHPHTALTQEVAALTELDADFVSTMQAVHDDVSLGTVMVQQPTEFLWYLRLGEQLLTSPMGLELLKRIQGFSGHVQTEDPDLHQSQLLLDHFVHGLQLLADNFATYLGQLEGEDAESLALGALQLEGIVARQLPSLPPLPHATPPEAQPAAPAYETDDTEAEEPAVQMTFQEAQLQVMRLSATLPDVLPDTLETPFTSAVGANEAFHTPLLPRLRQRLLNAAPDEPLGFTLPELVLLYRCAQVCAMTMLQPELERLFLQGVDISTDHDPEAASRVRHVLSIIVGGFVELVQNEYGAEPEFAQARQEMEHLADLL